MAGDPEPTHVQVFLRVRSAGSPDRVARQDIRTRHGCGDLLRGRVQCTPSVWACDGPSQRRGGTAWCSSSILDITVLMKSSASSFMPPATPP